MYFCAKFHIFYITLFWYVIALCLLGLYTLYYSYIITIVRFLFIFMKLLRVSPQGASCNHNEFYSEMEEGPIRIILNLAFFVFFQAVIENLKRFSSLGSI